MSRITVKGQTVYGAKSIVTDGLVLYLDAANQKSYSGTGTTWTDLSGYNNNGTLVNSPIFSNGLIILDGTNDYVSINGNANLYSSNFTWQSWHYYTAGGTSLSAMWWSEITVKNFLIAYANINLTSSYMRLDTLSSIYQSPSSGTNYNGFSGQNGTQLPLLNNWVQTTLIKNGTTFTLYWGTTIKWQITIPNWVISNTSQQIHFGAKSGTFASAMKLSSLMMYNRAITTDELSQNYNSLRGRFGL